MTSAARGSALEDARALHNVIAGRREDVVWSAPGRVNLIGEHTDYNEGFVLPFAIQQRTYAAVSLREVRRVTLVSTFSDERVDLPLDALGELFPVSADPNARPDAETHAGALPEWSRYVLGVAWALLEKIGSGRASRVPGLNIAIASDVPVGAGLSSSAALECAVATALDELWGLGYSLDPLTLARAGQRAENEAVGAPTGAMDQVASMLGRRDSATFIDCRTLEVRSVKTGFAKQSLEVLVIDTRVKHSHASGGYRERRASCERGAAALGEASLRDVGGADLPRAAELLDGETFRRVRHVVTENQRVLDTVATLKTEGPRAIGDLLIASHASLRDDFEVSIPELDLAVEASLAAGALGARMTGGGFGGAAIALVERKRVDTVSRAVRSAFAGAGYVDPHIFTVHPSEGPRRER